MRFETRKFDEVFGEVEDADRLAHVEHKNFAAVLHGRGLQNEIHGFGDGHKKTKHIRMRDGNGSAVGNLVFENGNDAAARAKHIAKADNGESALMTAGGVEDNHLGEAFGGAINAGRAHGFIGGDEDETFDVVRDCDLHKVTRAKHIVGDGFDGIGFHERDMLVRGGMKNNLRLMCFENRVKALRVADVGNDGDKF